MKESFFIIFISFQKRKGDQEKGHQGSDQYFAHFPVPSTHHTRPYCIGTAFAFDFNSGRQNFNFPVLIKNCLWDLASTQLKNEDVFINIIMCKIQQ